MPQVGGRLGVSSTITGRCYHASPIQQDYIRRMIKRARGNMTQAAELLGLHRSNLYLKMRQLEMSEARDNDE